MNRNLFVSSALFLSVLVGGCSADETPGTPGSSAPAQVYEIHHDESALRGARDHYGSKFVDKVLSRENDIAAAMNP